MAESKKSPKSKQPLVKCEYCSYTCHGKAPLHRHYHYHHPEHGVSREPKVAVSIRTLRGLMDLVDSDLAPGGLKKVSGKLGAAIHDQDLKLHLSLLAVAHAKAIRAVVLEGLLDRITTVLQTKLTPAVLEDMSADTLLGFLERLNKSITVDTDFLKGLLSIKDTGSRRFFMRVVEMLQSSASGARALEGTSGKLLKVLEAECSGMSEGDMDSFRDMIDGLSREETSAVGDVPRLTGG